MLGIEVVYLDGWVALFDAKLAWFTTFCMLLMFDWLLLVDVGWLALPIEALTWEVVKGCWDNLAIATFVFYFDSFFCISILAASAIVFGSSLAFSIWALAGWEAWTGWVVWADWVGRFDWAGWEGWIDWISWTGWLLNTFAWSRGGLLIWDWTETVDFPWLFACTA